MTASTCTDLYTRVTDRIIADLEQGVRPWLKPWDSRNAKVRITLPVRHNGTPYRGVNILLLWDETVNKGYATPVWMTWKQANQLHARIRKGEHGSLVVYADRFTRTETADNGEDLEREIPFLKGYIVFNVAQIEGLPDQYYIRSERKSDSPPPLENFERFFASTELRSVTAETWLTTLPRQILSNFLHRMFSKTPRATRPQKLMN
jgi:antirestriction protein ArdC